MVATAIDEYGVEETLDAVESEWLEMVAGNATIFQLAAHYADVCVGEGAPTSRRMLPGTERSVQLGGAGTPMVREFAAAEFGARMRMGTVGARHYIADALDSRHRLPKLWSRLCAGEVRVAWIRRVAARTRELSPEVAAKVDDEMVEIADGRLPWSRFCAVLEGKIVAADPETARRREEDRRREVFAKSSRYSEDGVKFFSIRAPIALIVRFDATVAYLAQALEALGDTDDEDHRRVKACAILANPTQAVELLAMFAAHRARAGEPEPADDPALDEGDYPLPDVDDPAPTTDAEDPDDAERSRSRDHQAPVTQSGEAADPTVPRPFRPAELPEWLRRACDPTTSVLLDWPKLLPTVCLYVHVAKETLDGATGGVARWEGESPITVQYVRDQLAPLHDIRVQPVLDLADQDPVDAYEISKRHRRAVHLRTPADCFPFSSNTSSAVDVDHTEEFVRHADGGPAEPGQSRMGNYSPLGRFHHRIKTHGTWTVRQPFDGIYVWRDPQGHFYLVDHTGTRKITPPGPRRPGTGAPRKSRKFDIEIVEPDFEIVLEEDLGHDAA
jgi:hypothetical protein